jgi:hypothetical protein
MEQNLSRQNPEYPALLSEVSRRLEQSGLQMETSFFSIIWGQVAEVLAVTLADHGITAEQVDDDLVIDLAQRAINALEVEDILHWREIVRFSATSSPILYALYQPPEPDNDDEGSLTELFENATRLGDDEGYWVDGGASADFED